MTTSHLITTATVLLGSCLMLGLAKSCPIGEFYLEVINGKETCERKCPVCLPGFEPIVPCYDPVYLPMTTVGCRKCKVGSYTKTSDTLPCQGCIKECPGNHFMVKKCGPSTPAECGCKRNHYEDDLTANCVHCCSGRVSLSGKKEKACGAILKTCKVGTDTNLTHKPSTVYLISESKAKTTKSSRSSSTPKMNPTTIAGNLITPSSNGDKTILHTKKEDNTSSIGLLVCILISMVLALSLVICIWCFHKYRKGRQRADLTVAGDGLSDHFESDVINPGYAASNVFTNPLETSSLIPVTHELERAVEHEVMISSHRRAPSMSTDLSIPYQDSGDYVTLRTDGNVCMYTCCQTKIDDDVHSCAGERNEDWYSQNDDTHCGENMEIVSPVESKASPVNQSIVAFNKTALPTSAKVADITSISHRSSVTINAYLNVNVPTDDCIYKKDTIVKSGLYGLADEDLNNEESRLCREKKLREADPVCGVDSCSQHFPDVRICSNAKDAPSTECLIKAVERKQSKDDLSGLSNNFEMLVLPEACRGKVENVRALLTKIGTCMPDFSVRSFVYWMKLEGRIDVVSLFHQKYHSSHEDG